MIPAQLARRRLLITWAVAGILTIVAAVTLAQHLHAVSHRYDQFDFSVFFGWWTDYSSGGNPWTDLRGPMRGCNYTPAFVAIFSPLARLDPRTAFWIWQIAQLLSLLTAMLLLARGSASPLGVAPTIIVLSLATLSRPFMAALAWSQMAPMLLMLLSAAWFCARRGSQAAAGLWLALAALLKLFPAGAAGYFLFGRRWRALGWTIFFFFAGVLVTNPVRWIELVTHGLPIAYRITGHAGLTVLSFVRKSVAHFGATANAGGPLFAVWGFTAIIDLALLAMAVAATLASRGRADLDGLLFGLWLALALLMSPLAWSQDTLLLIPAYLFGVIAGWEGFQSREAGGNIALIAGGAILAACIAAGLIKAVPHPGFPLVLAAYLGAALIFRARMRSESPPPLAS